MEQLCSIFIRLMNCEDRAGPMGHTTAAMTKLYSAEIPIDQVQAEFSSRLPIQMEKMEKEAA